MPSAGEVGDKMLMAVLYGFNGWDKYIWTGRFVAFALICAAIYVVNMPEAEAYHEDGVLDARLMPHHTHPPGSYWYERYHDPSFVMATIGRTVGGDEPHYAFGIARAIDLGYMARAYIHLPDHDGSIVNVSMSNASAYVEMVRRNATAPHEAAAALPVRTDTITILAAASAPEPLPSPHRDSLTLTPIVSDGHFIPSATGPLCGRLQPAPRHYTAWRVPGVLPQCRPSRHQRDDRRPGRDGSLPTLGRGEFVRPSGRRLQLLHVGARVRPVVERHHTYAIIVP